MANPTINRPALTAQRLRELLHYEPETGVFTRRVRTGCKTKAGEVAGGTNWAGYTQIRVDFNRYMAHRLAWLYMHGAWPQGSIDHIDGNPANNSFVNLRDVDHSANMQNQRKANRKSVTGTLGVSVGPKGKHIAKIGIGGKTHYIGSFDTAEDAHAAYVSFKRQHHIGCTI